MSYDITLLPYNELFYKIEAARGVLGPLRDYFSIRAPGFIFNPLYKNGLWNGFISLFKGDLFPVGLVDDLENYANSNHLTLFKPSLKQITLSDEYINDFLETTVLADLNKKSGDVLRIYLRDYQRDAVITSIKNRHQLIVSQTSTGKSLMIYMIVRLLQQGILFDNKMLIIVPSITLVEQMYKDFQNYSLLNRWDVAKYCTKLHSKAEPDFNKQILITTWQSLMDKPEGFFKDYQAVFLDEAHKIGKQNTKESREVEKEIIKCANAKFLLGFTGTLPPEILYKKKIQSYFGQVKEVTSYSEAIAAGNISDLSINILKLHYTSGFEGNLRNYKNEKSLIMSSLYRNNFIKKLLLKNKGNQLMLFMEIKKHAKIIYESLQQDERFKDYKIILLDSKSTVAAREDAKKLLETNNNVIVFGTYALLGTGWSVNNIWNIIFAAPLKSKIAVLQSIGRGLRLIPGEKKICQIWDIVDQFEYKNILYKHYLEREKYYHENKFKCNVINFQKEPQQTDLF